MTDELIVIKKSKLNSLIKKTLNFTYNLYIRTLLSTTLIWTNVFEKDSRIKLLLRSDAIVLLLNTILFAFIGNIFRGLIGQVLLIVCCINILMFLFERMGWVGKNTISK